MRRAAALFIVLMAAYAATLGTDSVPGRAHAEVEARHLRAADALVSGGGLDRRDAPHGIGFPLLIGPAHALGGPVLAALLVSALVALGFVLAAALARHVVPEPYATRGALAVGLSAPAVAHAGFLAPEAVAGTILAGALLLALVARQATGRRALAAAIGSGALLALLPWFSPALGVPAGAVLALLVYWLLRRRLALAALLAVEAVAASVLAYVRVNLVLYDAVAPGAEGVSARPAGLLVLLAPALLLSLAGAHALWRSRRERIARAVPERREVEAAAAAAIAVIIGCSLAALTASGDAFAGRYLVAALAPGALLVAWGLQRLPRLGTALAVLSALASAGVVIALHAGAIDAWARGG